MYDEDELSEEERESLLALAVHAITSPEKIGGLVIELILGGYGLALRVRYFRRLLVLCKALGIPVTVDEAMTFARARVARAGSLVHGAANIYLLEDYLPGISFDELGIAYVVAGKAIGIGILLSRTPDRAVLQTTTRRVSEQRERAAVIMLNEMRHGEITVDDLAESVRGDGDIVGVGALLYAHTWSGSDSTRESVRVNGGVPGRMLPGLRNRQPPPGAVSRGRPIREALARAIAIALKYHLTGTFSSKPVDIRRTWLRKLLSDASAGAGKCVGGGMGADATAVVSTGGSRVWSKEWFSWMGNADDATRRRRRSLADFLELTRVTHDGTVGAKRCKVRYFEIAGFQGVTCGVVARDVLTHACRP